MKPWQRGYELSTLQAITKVFKTCYKPYSFGAFEVPNEATVADALSKTRCFGGAQGGKWVAIGQRLSKPSTQVDFTSAGIVLPAGVFMVSDFACMGNYESALIALLTSINHTGVIEIHEENQALKNAICEHGGEYLLTKVSASSQLRSLYTFGLPNELKVSQADALTLGCVRPDFISQVDIDDALREIESFGVVWAQHYSNYNKHQTWTAFALRGYQPADPTFIIKPQEMARSWKKENSSLLNAKPQDTIAAPRLPALMRIAAKIPGPKDRIRLMRLTPQGELTRHADITDRSAGTADNHVARLHIPLITNDGVDFHAINHRGKQITAHMRPGSLYYLDQRKPHFVQNHSPELERIHFVVDTFCTPQLRKALERAHDGD